MFQISAAPQLADIESQPTLTLQSTALLYLQRIADLGRVKWFFNSPSMVALKDTKSQFYALVDLRPLSQQARQRQEVGRLT